GPYFYIWDNGTTDDFQTGLEDGTYAVTIIDDNGCVDTASAVLESSCPVPDGASVNNITFTKATVSWIADDCATRYRVQVRQQGTTTWTTYQSMTNERVVKNLMPGTTYQYRVRVVCSPTGGASVSPWTGMQTFTTPGSCTAPSGLGATPSDTSAFVSWTAGTGVVKYRLRYRVQGTTTWTPMVIGGAITSKTINGLMANTTYEYQMRSQCNVAGTDFSPYTAIETFTTAMRLGQSDDATLALYPNPNTRAFNLTFTSAVRENVTVSVYDMLGRNVSAQALAVHNGLNNLALNLELAAGQYIVKVEGSANTHVMRFTVK
ncbi:MAG TPA: fibronectin type III domain-containing protein, partial [Chitinophagales bacterium]|nr:fibronectin type III domain-containing protein [Chitinophagales bacterium]